MARRRLTEVIAFVLLAGVPGACLAQFGGPNGPEGMPGPPPGMPGAPSRQNAGQTPEMARRLDTVRVLREIVRMRLGKAEIASALPSLRALLQADKTAQARTVEALEQEKRALLAARSPDDMPATAVDRLRQIAQKLRSEQDKRWGELARAVGSARAGELRRLLNPIRMGPPWPAGLGPPNGPGGPGGPGDGGPGMPPDGPRRPGQRPGGGREGMPGSPGFNLNAVMDAPYISLADLISLLEQRLAALK